MTSIDNKSYNKFVSFQPDRKLTAMTAYLLALALFIYLAAVQSNIFLGRRVPAYKPSSTRNFASIGGNADGTQLVKTSLSMSVNKNGPPKIIIAGAPAAGKGTQCEFIQRDFGVVHLSTGDLLRAAVKEQSALGVQAKAFMDAGKLVPDELIIDVVCDRLKQPDCQNQGWLLDGFPRTKAQADALTKAGMIPDCFILLDVPEQVLVERVTGRRTDPVTGKIYHLKFNPPESPEIAARLTQRSDDTEEKIVTRYRDFISNIDAVKGSYADKLVRVDGTQSQGAVSEIILNTLKSFNLSKTKPEVQGQNSSSVGGVLLASAMSLLAFTADSVAALSHTVTVLV